MMKQNFTIAILGFAIVLGANSCKKEGCTDETATNYNSKAKKDDGSCVYDNVPSYTIPTSYNFTDANGNNTVSYSGQTERLNQLREIVVKLKTGTSTTINAQDLIDMYRNTGGNGNGNFTFSSTKQLKDKTFIADQTQFETWMTNAAIASQSFGSQASNGQAGTLTTGSKTYLFDENGFEPLQLIEKGLMGACFMNQSLNVYFGPGKMDVDNSVAVNEANGEYYTVMEHSWDEAFGYFGVPTTFPTDIPSDFWGKYSNNQHALLNSNTDMMNNFLKGRAAIVSKNYTDRDAAILALRREWEDISANQAIAYIDASKASFGADNAAFLHSLSEAYAFAWNLRYAPVETRRMSQSEHVALMAMFGTNLWNLTLADLNAIKSSLNSKY